MVKKIVRVVGIMLATAILGACVPQGGVQTSAAQPDSVACRKTEQKGCLEIDILNLRAPTNFNVQKDGKPHGPTYYEKFLKGELQPAAARTYVVYVWNVDQAPTNLMAEYRLPADYRQKVNENRNKRYTTALTPLPVSEIPATSGPTFGTEYNIGQPQRAFRITVQNAGGALQVPKGMFGKNSYLLICPEGSDGVTVFPDRITRKDGYWLTPRDLTAPGDYIVVPFLFNT